MSPLVDLTSKADERRKEWGDPQLPPRRFYGFIEISLGYHWDEIFRKSIYRDIMNIMNIHIIDIMNIIGMKS